MNYTEILESMNSILESIESNEGDDFHALHTVPDRCGCVFRMPEPYNRQRLFRKAAAALRRNCIFISAVCRFSPCIFSGFFKKA